MHRIVRSIWFDVIIVLTVLLVCYAGMQGFRYYFTVLMAVSLVYLTVFVIRLFPRRPS